MRAGLYARVSTKEQADGYSIAAQLHALRALAESRGWEVVGEYVEEGKSARSEDIRRRPQFRAMMDDALSGKLDIVAVHKLDRFSRNLRLTLEYFERLSKAGVTFLSISEQMDFSQPWGKFALSRLGAMAQFYSENLGLETKKGKQERKAQGLYLGLLPFGMMKGETGVPVANPQTLPGLRMAFELAGQGHTDRQIAEALNLHGYRSAGNRGPRPFSKDTVRGLLQNRFYLGSLPDGNGGWIEGKHDGVIEPSLWEEAQRARARNRKAPRTVPRQRTTSSLTGLARCAECGSRLNVLDVVGGRRRIGCRGRDQGLECTQPSCYLDVLEDQIAAYLAAFHIPSDYQKRILEMHSKLTDAYSETEKRQAALRERLGRLRDLYEMGDLGRGEYVTRRDRLQDELGRLVPDGSKPEVLQRLARFLMNVAEAWEAAGQEQRNRLARALFEEVWVKDKKVVAVVPRPELEPFFALRHEGDDKDGLRKVFGNWRPRRASNPRSLVPAPSGRKYASDEEAGDATMDSRPSRGICWRAQSRSDSLYSGVEILWRSH